MRLHYRNEFVDKVKLEACPYADLVVPKRFEYDKLLRKATANLHDRMGYMGVNLSVDIFLKIKDVGDIFHIDYKNKIAKKVSRNPTNNIVNLKKISINASLSNLCLLFYNHVRLGHNKHNKVHLF